MANNEAILVTAIFLFLAIVIGFWDITVTNVKGPEKSVKYDSDNNDTVSEYSKLAQ